jgi:hypothetical protein
MSLTPRLNKLEQNLFINGDKSISQRLGLLGLTTFSGFDVRYILDREQIIHLTAGAGVVDVSQVASHPTLAESGYSGKNATRIEVTTDQASVGAGDTLVSVQRVEGNTWKKAKAEGKHLVHVFWARSNKSMNISAGGDSSSDGSTQSAHWRNSIALDGSGVWKRYVQVIDPTIVPVHEDTGIAVTIGFTLAAGTNYQSSVIDQWDTVDIGKHSDDQIGNFWDTVGNYIEYTQSALIPVDRPTADLINSLQFVPHSKEAGGDLRACQRYYEKSYAIDTTPGSFIDGEGAVNFNTGILNTDQKLCTTFYKVTKRVDVPTVVTYSPITGASGMARSFNAAGGTPSDEAASISGKGRGSFAVSITGASRSGMFYQWTADAEL